MKFIKKTSVLFFLTLFSCKNYYYLPTQQQIPLFTEKNELHFTGGTDGQEFNNFQSSYSITKSVAFQINTLYRIKKDRYLNYGYLIEGGPGYHLNLNKNFIVEAFAGYGTAEINKYSDFAHLAFNRFYIYPIFGFQSKYFDFAYSIRYNALTYRYKGPLPNYDKAQTAIWAPYNLNNKSFHFWEPAFTLRLGYKYLKLQGQYNWIMENEYTFNYIKNNISVSVFLMFPLDEIFKGEK